MCKQAHDSDNNNTFSTELEHDSIGMLASRVRSYDDGSDDSDNF
jgi:hypothetical protein